jgi:NADH:ubiquinone oxidoreductase subunit K
MAAVEFQIPSQVYLLLMVAVAVAEVVEISLGIALQLFVRATHRKQELVEVAAVVTEGYAQILRHLEHQILAVVVVVVACTT